MKASHRRPTARAASMLAMLTTSLLLVQCSMPPQQAWRSIQTQGLLTYLSSPRQPSPPFRTGSSYAQRYAALPRRSYYGTSNGYAPNSYLNTFSTGTYGSRYAPRTRLSSASPERKPDVKIPVEEPNHAHAPQVAHHAPSTSPAPKSDDTDPAALSTDSLPYGTAVAGRVNMVNSPFAGKTQLVDVSGMSAGQTVKCPYTGKLFRVPPTQQATNTVESKIEAPKLGEEPPAGDKKP